MVWPIKPIMQRLLTVVVGLGVFFLIATLYLGNMTTHTEVAYAHRTVFELQEDRDAALRSDVPEAAKRLLYVSSGKNGKQRSGSPLDQVCNLQRTNIVRDIIAYLRVKTG